MLRALTLALLLGTASHTFAAETPQGSWKLQFVEGQQTITFLVALDKTDKGWTGKFLSSSVPLNQEPSFKTLAVNDGKVEFELTFAGETFVTFDGTFDAKTNRIIGSMNQFGGSIALTKLYPSELKTLDDIVPLALEDFGQSENTMELYDAGILILSLAEESKLEAKTVQPIVDRLNKESKEFGPRWQRMVAVRTASVLAKNKTLSDMALSQAKLAEGMLTDDSPMLIQLEVAQLMRDTLTATGKPDEAKTYTQKVAKLEEADYQAFLKESISFKLKEMKPTDVTGNQTVFVELFTGADCPPCVAADIACDALGQTFSGKQVTIVQYHLHVPGPDPLTSPVSIARAQYYGDAVGGAPTLFINGQAGPAGGGPVAMAKDKYEAYLKAIEPKLADNSSITIPLTIKLAEKGFEATAKVELGDLDPGKKKLRLRFLLVEERVAYAGGNGIRYHHNVVRAMPGQPEGIALDKKSTDANVNFVIDDVKKTIADYLTSYETQRGPFRDKPSIDSTKLKLIAFVQDDESKAVLQVVEQTLPTK